jgi:Protein of unknown function (DUF4013)
MNYLAAIKDFFKSPKWMMNLLLGGVCCLIPFVGVMVVIGWLITGFWCRSDQRFETFPDFDFGKFGKNLERGLWPVLAGLAVGVVIAPIMFIIEFGAILMTGGFVHRGGISFFGILVMMFVALFMLALSAGLSIIGPPIYLRAARMQDFMPAFNFAYIKRFATAMWKECLMVFLFSFVVGIAAGIVCLIPCIGALVVILCVAMLAFMHFHLGNQLYQLFVSRGGEAIPLSPKLTEEPPPASTPPAAPPLPPA